VLQILTFIINFKDEFILGLENQQAYNMAMNFKDHVHNWSKTKCHHDFPWCNHGHFFIQWWGNAGLAWKSQLHG
jgi:hypothetical protein